MTRILLALWFIVCLMSCKDSGGKHFYIIIDRVDGLIEGSKVESKGLVIGKVSDLMLYQDKVLVKILIESKYKLPVASQFRLSGESIFNSNSTIEVQFSKNLEFYHSGDTIKAVSVGQQYSLDRNLLREGLDTSSIKGIKKIMEGVVEVLKTDTLNR